MLPPNYSFAGEPSPFDFDSKGNVKYNGIINFHEKELRGLFVVCFLT